MDKTITTAILTIASVLMALMLFNAAYPAVQAGGDSIARMANRVEQEMVNEITVIHAVGELDADGWWQDVNSNGDFEVFVWVKNVGSDAINALDQLDVFFGPDGNFVRIPHQSAAGGSYPYWTWELENSAAWGPSATLKVVVHYQFPLSAGRYFFKVTTPIGVFDDYFLGM